MTDIFEGTPKEEGTPPVTPPVTPPGVSGTDTYLSLILNEDGTQKYATAEEALKGSVHAQSHIGKLESELKELRENADKGVSMEQVLEAINKPKEGEPAQQVAGVTAEDVASQVEQLLDKRNTETTRKDNITTVTTAFKTLYGDKASETMYAKANDLGFNEDEINGMIATNPTATLKILGIGGVKPIQRDPVTDGGGHIVDLSDGKPTEKPETIMGATDSKTLTDSWKASQAATNKRLGVEIPT